MSLAAWFTSIPAFASDTSVGPNYELAQSDSRLGLLVFVFLPAIGWVLFNIFEPALNQVND